jgi:hypothetical protein
MRACVPITTWASPLFIASSAGEEHDVDREVGEGARDREVVLLGEDLGRGHDGALAPGLDGCEERGDRDYGLAAADIPLQEAAHGPLRSHVGQDLLYHPLLRSCELERQTPQIRVQEAPVARVPRADLGPLQAGLAGGESGLYQEELVEDQTPQGVFEADAVRGEVDLVEGVVQVGEVVTGQYLGG